MIDAGTLYTGQAIVSYPAGPQPQMSIPPTAQPYPVSLVVCAFTIFFSRSLSLFFRPIRRGSRLIVIVLFHGRPHFDPSSLSSAHHATLRHRAFLFPVGPLHFATLSYSLNVGIKMHKALF